MNYCEERNYLGNTRQLFRVDEYRKIGGRGDGMRVAEVKNGRDLCFSSVMDRCMDIHYLEPCNATLGGLQENLDKGSAKYLEARQSVHYDLIIQLLEGRDDYDALLRESESYR